MKFQTVPPAFALHRDVRYEYVPSRKMYLQEYCKLSKKMPAMRIMLDMLKSGQNIMILDGDGPPLGEFPEGIAVNSESVNRAYMDPRHPFGHGYIVAMILHVMLDHVDDLKLRTGL